MKGTGKTQTVRMVEAEPETVIDDDQRARRNAVKMETCKLENRR